MEYFHVVFTVPEDLKPLFLVQPERSYGLLFQAVASTLTEVAVNPKRLGARIGFSAVLLTWTQTLVYHPHIHDPQDIHQTNRSCEVGPVAPALQTIGMPKSGHGGLCHQTITIRVLRVSVESGHRTVKSSSNCEVCSNLDPHARGSIPMWYEAVI